jgi:hypothetical protein
MLALGVEVMPSLDANSKKRAANVDPITYTATEWAALGLSNTMPN